MAWFLLKLKVAKKLQQNGWIPYNLSQVKHVADIPTCALHPEASTQRQLNDEELVTSGISAGLIRISCGIENIEDILADIQQAFDAI